MSICILCQQEHSEKSAEKIKPLRVQLRHSRWRYGNKNEKSIKEIPKRQRPDRGWRDWKSNITIIGTGIVDISKQKALFGDRAFLVICNACTQEDTRGAGGTTDAQ